MPGHQRDATEARLRATARGSSHGARVWNTVSRNYGLGFTAFGGPPVHFKIFHDKFVRKLQWVDEQVYQELFSVCQAISGPASTKMHYCINLIHNGFLSAVVGFFLWSLPGAIAMYGLSTGVSHVGTTLPSPVYALLSGLNASTVGIIALAAVQLSETAITDKLTRILVFFGAAAGMLYNAIWYFPVLIAVSGCVTVVQDLRWTQRTARRVRLLTRRFGRRQREEGRDGEEQAASVENGAASQVDGPSSSGQDRPTTSLPIHESDPPSTEQQEPRNIPPERRLNYSWKLGTTIIASFFATFLTIMVLRATLHTSSPSSPSSSTRDQPLLFRFFANMYLAGTIIFGGGPVVIPLLREYVVAEHWVSPRDFLIGLAVQQALPGPNFNFAVYLGALTASNAGQSSLAGAVLGYVGIFVPGMVLVHGTMGIWSAIRGVRWVRSVLRGVNAAAVGLIYTAVYRLWQIGYVDEGFEQGTSLGMEPWWVVVTASSYVGGYWFGVSPPVAILMGAMMGLVRYGVVST